MSPPITRGSAPTVARRIGALYARGHCRIFWFCLLAYGIISLGGIWQLIQRGSIYTQASQYDWDVNGKVPVQENDMVEAIDDLRESIRAQLGLNRSHHQQQPEQQQQPEERATTEASESSVSSSVSSRGDLSAATDGHLSPHTSDNYSDNYSYTRGESDDSRLTLQYEWADGDRQVSNKSLLTRLF